MKQCLEEQDKTISKIINMFVNIEKELLNNKNVLHNTDVNTADVLHKIRKIEELLRDKYFKINLAD